LQAKSGDAVAKVAALTKENEAKKRQMLYQSKVIEEEQTKRISLETENGELVDMLTSCQEILSDNIKDDPEKKQMLIRVCSRSSSMRKQRQSWKISKYGKLSYLGQHF